MKKQKVQLFLLRFWDLIAVVAVLAKLLHRAQGKVVCKAVAVFPGLVVFLNTRERIWWNQERKVSEIFQFVKREKLTKHRETKQKL